MKKIVWVMILVLAWAAQSFAAMEWQALSVPEMAQKDATHVAVVEYKDFTVTATNAAVQTFTNAIPAGYIAEFAYMDLVTAFDIGTTSTQTLSLTVGDGSTADLFLAATELASDGTEIFTKYGPANSVAVTASGRTWTNVATEVTSRTYALSLTNAVKRTYTNVATVVTSRTYAKGLTNSVKRTYTNVATIVSSIVLTNVIYDGGATTGNVTIPVVGTIENVDVVNGDVSDLVCDQAGTIENINAVNGDVASIVCDQASTIANIPLINSVTAAGTVTELGRKSYATAGNIVLTFTPSATLQSLSEYTKGEVRVYFRVYKKSVN